jgi:hypothetical protein
MGLGHRRYLKSPKAAAEVAEIISPGLSRAVGSRHLPEEELPEPRKVASREVASRSVGDGLEAEWVNCWPIAGDVTRAQL